MWIVFFGTGRALPLGTNIRTLTCHKESMNVSAHDFYLRDSDAIRSSFCWLFFDDL